MLFSFLTIIFILSCSSKADSQNVSLNKKQLFYLSI